MPQLMHQQGRSGVREAYRGHHGRHYVPVVQSPGLPGLVVLLTTATDPCLDVHCGVSDFSCNATLTTTETHCSALHVPDTAPDTPRTHLAPSVGRTSAYALGVGST